MIVNFTSKKVSPNFKIFFINKDKKNLKYHNISSNSEIKKNVLNSLSKKKFKGSLGQICHIETINDKHAENTIFIGIGDETKIEDFNFQYFGGLLLSYFENLKYKKISIYVGDLKKVKLSYEDMILHLASGIHLKSYSFKKYKKKRKKTIIRLYQTLILLLLIQLNSKNFFQVLKLYQKAFFLHVIYYMNHQMY